MGIKPLYFLTSFRDQSYYNNRSVYLDNAVHLFVLHIEDTWGYKNSETILSADSADYLHLPLNLV